MLSKFIFRILGGVILLAGLFYAGKGFAEDTPISAEVCVEAYRSLQSINDAVQKDPGVIQHDQYAEWQFTYQKIVWACNSSQIHWEDDWQSPPR